MCSFLCRVFGHAMPRKSWASPGELYGQVTGGYTDNVGRTHFTVRHVCPRCKTKWEVAKFHGASVTTLLDQYAKKGATHRTPLPTPPAQDTNGDHHDEG